MKHLYAFLLFAISFTTANAQLTASPIAPYAICETNTDGFAAFDLKQYVASVLSIDPLLYSITFYVDSDLSVEIQNPTAYTNTSQSHQTIYFRVTEIATPTNTVANSLDLYVENAPKWLPQSTLTACDDDIPGDGLSTFNLTLKEAELKQGCSTCTVTYIGNDVNFNEIQIPNPEAFKNNTYPFWVVAEVQATDGISKCKTSSLITLRVLPAPFNPYSYIAPITSCTTIFNLTLNKEHFYTDTTITYHATEAEANSGINTIANPVAYDLETDKGSVWIREAVTNSSLCYNVKEQFLLGKLTASINLGIVGTTVTVFIAIGEYEYFLDEAIIPQSSNIFTGLTPGDHIIKVVDKCQNVFVRTFTITNPPSPTGSNIQVFTDGQTLANLTVNGENITWYTTATDFTVLPKETLLVDGTTYYAAQTIDNNQSANRLAVTAKRTLGINDLHDSKLNYYPNPVTNVFTINNPVNITAVNVYNTLGQVVINQKTNSTNVQLNLQTLTSGVYIVKVTSGLNTQSFKIIKR